MSREKHRTDNVVIHDWQTTDRVCERCGGTVGRLEQTLDPAVQLYRCWCGKVSRIVKPSLLDDIRAAITAYRETPAAQAHLLMSRLQLDAVLGLPDDEQAQCVADVVALAATMGLGLPVVIFVHDTQAAVAQINADRTITRL